MKWLPVMCVPGDLIRVRTGGVYHYGVFVSEDEVIQFGMPPDGISSLLDPSDIRVCVTDISGFCRGAIVEKAHPEHADGLKPFAPEEIVARARGRIGEGSYNLLHNNCEHFAYDCVYGVRRCEQAETVRDRLKSIPVLDVFISPIQADTVFDPDGIYPPERAAELASVANEKVRTEKYTAWKTLGYAALRTFSLQMRDIAFEKTEYGKWQCDRFYFSLTHTEGYVAVAVSNGQVGIDAENTEAFEQRFTGRNRTEPLRAYVLAPGEPADAELIDLWTKKEAMFKCDCDGAFVPRSLDTSGRGFAVCDGIAGCPLRIAVCGEHIANIRYYIFDGSSASRVTP